jgi:arylsulfatase A-like enzyme
VATRVSLVDVLPSLLDLVGVSRDAARVQGRSWVDLLRDPGARSAPTPTFVTGVKYGTEKYALVRDRLKIIRNTGSLRGKEALQGPSSPWAIELYDPREDPGERENLAEFLEVLVETGEDATPRQETEISPELRERLRALGYLD